jgi:heme oxygenase
MPANPEILKENPLQNSEDILTQLREGTRSHHTSIEKSIPVFRKDLNLVNYTHILERFYGFYEPLEAALEKKLAAIPGLDFAARKKLALLEKDLLFLGKTTAELLALPRCDQLPECELVPQALGDFYVLEGSTLGGQFITKHVQKTLAVDATSGGAFYASYGADTKAQWKNFQAVLVEQLQTATDRRAAVNAAQQTFRNLEAWMAPVAE